MLAKMMGEIEASESELLEKRRTPKTAVSNPKSGTGAVCCWRTTRFKMTVVNGSDNFHIKVDVEPMLRYEAFVRKVPRRWRQLLTTMSNPIGGSVIAFAGASSEVFTVS